MDLNSILPCDERWSLGYGDRVIYYKKLMKIPLLILIDDVPHIILENKLVRQVIQLTKILIDSGQEFYFTIPDAVNPAGVADYKEEVIYSYLYAYSNYKFYNEFRQIGFDLIENMVKWCDKEDCWELVKPIYERVNKSIQRKEFDWYSKSDIFNYRLEIREDFLSLWREMQINKIL
jgi:hypothetical protein